MRIGDKGVKIVKPEDAGYLQKPGTVNIIHCIIICVIRCVVSINSEYNDMHQ